MDKKLLLAGVSALAMSLPALAQADDSGAVAQVNPLLIGTVSGNTTSDPGQIRPNLIDGSFNSVDGVVHTQQNEGSSNAINAAGAVQVQINQGTPTVSTAEVNSHSTTNHAIQDTGSRDNDITGSFVDSHGVLTVQQNNGDNNEIGSAEAIQAHQNSTGPVSTTAGTVSAADDNESRQNGGSRENDITGSFRQGTAGVMTVQQNNGDNNAIGAATAVYGASGGYGDVTQSVYATGDVIVATTRDYYARSDNSAAANVRHNSIDPSFDGAAGIATVQQNNGSANALSASTAVAGNVGGQHDIADGPDDQDNVDQGVFVSGSVTGRPEIDNTDNGEGVSVVEEAVTTDNALARSNDLINGSFDAFQGIATVQQNNGDANVISTGTAVNFNAGLAAPELQNDLSQVAVASASSRQAHALHQTGVKFSNGIGTWFGARSNLTDSVFNGGAAGIATVQQNNGNLNVIGVSNAVQANVDTTASALDGNDDVSPQTAFAGGQVSLNRNSQGIVLVTDDGEGGSLAAPARDNLIDNAFTGYQGLANVQQNNGDGNIMNVANAVTAVINSTDKIDNVGGPGVDAGSGAGTSGVVTRSNGGQATGEPIGAAITIGPERRNTVGPSFTGFAGIANVQQNNGDNSVINAATAVSANIGPVGDGGDDAAAAVNNGVSGTGLVTDNTAFQVLIYGRRNEVTNAFAGARGIMTVQQNNGSNNVMGAATAVAADIDTGTTGFGPALSMVSLSGSVTGNTSILIPRADGSPLVNTINAGAFNTAAGIMTVQQNNGDNTLMQSAIAVTANLTTNQ